MVGHIETCAALPSPYVSSSLFTSFYECAPMDFKAWGMLGYGMVILLFLLEGGQLYFPVTQGAFKHFSRVMRSCSNCDSVWHLGGCNVFVVLPGVLLLLILF